MECLSLNNWRPNAHRIGVILFSILLLLYVLLFVVNSTFGTDDIEGELYIIAAGDTIFTGSDFDSYNRSNSELGLSEKGVSRLAELRRVEIVDGRSTYEFGRLVGKKFRLEISGLTVSEGHFSAMYSSQWRSGLVIWEPLSNPIGKRIRLTFSDLNSVHDIVDPRDSEVFLRFFESRGKLVEGASER